MQISSFCSWKKLVLCISAPPGWDGSPAEDYCSSIKYANTNFYTWVERRTVREQCLAQEHNAISPAGARTQIARSWGENTSYEAISLPTSQWYLYKNHDKINHFRRDQILCLLWDTQHALTCGTMKEGDVFPIRVTFLHFYFLVEKDLGSLSFSLSLMLQKLSSGFKIVPAVRRNCYQPASRKMA